MFGEQLIFCRIELLHRRNRVVCNYSNFVDAVVRVAIDIPDRR